MKTVTKHRPMEISVMRNDVDLTNLYYGVCNDVNLGKSTMNHIVVIFQMLIT